MPRLINLHTRPLEQRRRALRRRRALALRGAPLAAVRAAAAVERARTDGERDEKLLVLLRRCSAVRPR